MDPTLFPTLGFVSILSFFHWNTAVASLFKLLFFKRVSSHHILENLLFLQRYLKIGEGNFIIAIDWSKNEDVAGFFVDANMDPETAYTETDARVYVLETIVPEPTTTMVPENSKTSDTGISQTIGTT